MTQVLSLSIVGTGRDDYLRDISLNWSQSNSGLEASAWVQEQTPIPEYEPARILPYDGCIP